MMKEEIEIWAPIRGWIGYYEVSNKGRVRSLDRFIPFRNGQRFSPGKILTNSQDGLGFYHVVLSDQDRRECRYVHRLVAEAFVKMPPVRHKNGDKTDNRVENLEFYDVDTTQEALSQRGQYYREHRDYYKAYREQWKKNHPDYHKEYYQKQKNLGKIGKKSKVDDEED